MRHASSEKPCAAVIIDTSESSIRLGAPEPALSVGPIKPAHLELLKKYLDVAKGAMEVEDETAEGEPKE